MTEHTFYSYIEKSKLRNNTHSRIVSRHAVKRYRTFAVQKAYSLDYYKTHNFSLLYYPLKIHLILDESKITELCWVHKNSWLIIFLRQNSFFKLKENKAVILMLLEFGRPLLPHLPVIPCNKMSFCVCMYVFSVCSFFV